MSLSRVLKGRGKYILGLGVLASLSMGSIALAQEGAEAPAAEVVQQEAPPAPAYLSHDEQITQHIGELFGQFEGLKSVEFKVRAGLVTLTGAVSALEQRQQAERIASKVEHVLAVQNLIQVQESAVPQETSNSKSQAEVADEEAQALKENLEDIYSEVNGLSDVKVKVKSGIVTLTGEVLGEDERTQAAELTQKVDGVLYVVNDLSIPTEISERVRPAFSQAKTIVAKVVAALPLLLIALVLLVITWTVSGAVKRWDWPYRRLEGRPLIRELVRQVVSTAVLILGLLLIFELLDITAVVGALLGTAGIAGLAIGFAFQDIVENYLSSLMLSARQPYKKGDVVQIGDQTGKIVRMTMRDTVLMTFDGNHVRIPNAQVFKSVLTNYSHNPRRRFTFNVGIGTKENLLEARRIGLEAIASIDGVMKDPAPFMTIDELADSSVVCAFYGWVDQREHDWVAMRSEAIRRVKVRYDKEGFDMPEPIYRLQITEHAMAGDEEEEQVESSKRPAEPLEDTTMQDSINEDKNLDQQLESGDDREKENLL